ncbi:MAG: DUF1232 domain-containing protein [Holophagales bacterium]|nr:DUF1232 domain-containing protein [Holophagales bacterium]
MTHPSTDPGPSADPERSGEAAFARGETSGTVLSESELDESTALAGSLIEEPDDDLPSSGLLSFYDRLRGRMVAYGEKKGGTMARPTIEALLLVPDVFILLARLALDNEVPKHTRALIGSALAYFVLPVDFLPEALLGPAAYTDDLVLGLTVLSRAFGQELEPFAAKYWSGSRSLHRSIGDTLYAAQGLLSADVYNRLKDLLAAQGIDLDRARQEASEQAT